MFVSNVTMGTIWVWIIFVSRRTPCVRRSVGRMVTVLNVTPGIIWHKVRVSYHQIFKSTQWRLIKIAKISPIRKLTHVNNVTLGTGWLREYVLRLIHCVKDLTKRQGFVLIAMMGIILKVEIVLLIWAITPMSLIHIVLSYQQTLQIASHAHLDTSLAMMASVVHTTHPTNAKHSTHKMVNVSAAHTVMCLVNKKHASHKSKTVTNTVHKQNVLNVQLGSI